VAASRFQSRVSVDTLRMRRRKRQSRQLAAPAAQGEPVLLLLPQHRETTHTMGLQQRL
jgi:hypothetical protein